MADSPSFNWLLEPPDHQRQHVNQIARDLGRAFASIFDSSESNDEVLIRFSDGGFNITFGGENQENQLSQDTFIGAGEVGSIHGRLPLLFFATLKKQLIESLAPDSDNPISFCNERGEEVKLDDMSQLDSEAFRLGIDTSGFREDAESVGFVEKLYKFDQLAPTEPSLFF